MGGNALPNTITRRYAADEYFRLEADTHKTLDWLFPSTRFETIQAYRSKESFGDMDIIIESDNLPSCWQENLIDAYALQQNEWFKNGNCFSFAHKQLQIDLIVTPSEEYQTSLNYFAYNDLGNLIGRIAHMMGLKLGHDGLAYNWRIDETQHFRTVVIETDWAKILPVLGLSYERYAQGFDTLEDIFKFVVSSPYFNKDIYLLHNRNNVSRVRDRKRKTYMEFLKWIESYEETEEQFTNKAWVTYNRNQFSHKKFWLPYLFKEMPHFEVIYKEVQAEWDEAVEYKRRFNGDLVRGWLGIEGKELGDFMRWLRENTGSNFKRDILNMNPTLVERYVLYFYDKYMGRLPIINFDAEAMKQHRVKG